MAVTLISWGDVSVGTVLQALSTGGIRKDHSARIRTTAGYESVKSDIIGVRLKATCKLRKGDIVLEEKPLICVPEHPRAVGLWCMICFRPIYNEGIAACPSGDCMQRFCGERCARHGSKLHEWDCRLQGIVEQAWPDLSAKARAVVTRGLALRLAGEAGEAAAAKAHAALIQLEAHLDTASKCDPAYSRWRSGAQRLVVALSAIAVTTTVEELLTLHFIHRVNGMRLAPRGDTHHGHGGVVAIFPTVSRLEHNCDPTCAEVDKRRANREEIF